jgi:primosomal protein N'
MSENPAGYEPQMKAEPGIKRVDLFNRLANLIQARYDRQLARKAEPVSGDMVSVPLGEGQRYVSGVVTGKSTNPDGSTMFLHVEIEGVKNVRVDPLTFQIWEKESLEGLDAVSQDTSPVPPPSEPTSSI